MTSPNLEQLRELYATKLPERLEELRQAVNKASESDVNSPEITAAMALAHKLAGTAGTYGFMHAADLAKACELELSNCLADNVSSPGWEQLLSKFLYLYSDQSDSTPQMLDLTMPAVARGNNEPILVIDDEEDFLALIAEILMQANYQPVTRTHVTGLKELVERVTPQVILLDIEMPQANGLEVCRRIKSYPSCREIPIFFLTNRNSVHDRIAAFHAGADDFINKPIVAEELLARVDVRIEKSRMLRQKEQLLNQVEQHRDSLLALLDQLQIGSLLLTPDGQVTYVSRYCRYLGLSAEPQSGLHWQALLPLDREGNRAFRQQLMLAPEQRSKLALSWHIDTQSYFVDCEIYDVPGAENQQIVYLTDVSELRRLQQQLEQSRYGRLIGSSPPMRELYRMIGEVARGDWTVLIEGETGVGKELVAHSVHANSPRSSGPFIAVNSAGLSESLLTSQLFGHRKGAFTGAVSDQQGYFEAAEGGTLFLDEIGDLPLSMQSSLLRVLQEKKVTRVGETREREVDVRILAATHKDLAHEVSEGRFRQDLLYRLRVGRLCVPALRERKADIPLLVDAFIEQSDAVSGVSRIKVSNKAMQQLLNYAWPGNVRELKAIVDYALIHSHGDEISCDNLPAEIVQAPSPAVSMPSAPGDVTPPMTVPMDTSLVPTTPENLPNVIQGADERSRILAALQQAGGNRAQAAKLLGISRATFYRRIDKLGISEDI